MFIGLTGFMSIIGLYRGMIVAESYQQLIGYISAVLCLIIMLLLIWGLHLLPLSSLFCMLLIMFLRFSIIYLEV